MTPYRHESIIWHLFIYLRRTLKIRVYEGGGGGGVALIIQKHGYSKHTKQKTAINPVIYHISRITYITRI